MERWVQGVVSHVAGCRQRRLVLAVKECPSTATATIHILNSLNGVDGPIKNYAGGLVLHIKPRPAFRTPMPPKQQPGQLKASEGQPTGIKIIRALGARVQAASPSQPNEAGKNTEQNHATPVPHFSAGPVFNVLRWFVCGPVTHFQCKQSRALRGAILGCPSQPPQLSDSRKFR